MTLKNYSTLAILALTSGCSLLPTKEVEIVSKPIEVEILQPTLPRPVDLVAPQWWVVSEARIANPCKKVEDKRPKTCNLEDRENPDWPEGYTYYDRFIDENGNIIGSGIKYKLRPLHTEGQGMEGGPDEFKEGETYSNIAICMPIGFGIKKALVFGQKHRYSVETNIGFR